PTRTWSGASDRTRCACSSGTSTRYATSSSPTRRTRACRASRWRSASSASPRRSCGSQSPADEQTPITEGHTQHPEGAYTHTRQSSEHGHDHETLKPNPEPVRRCPVRVQSKHCPHDSSENDVMPGADVVTERVDRGEARLSPRRAP